MRWVLIAAVILVSNSSCTTLSNRRDLYSPTQQYEPVRNVVIVTTTRTHTRTSRDYKSGPITPDEEPVLPP